MHIRSFSIATPTREQRGATARFFNELVAPKLREHYGLTEATLLFSNESPMVGVFHFDQEPDSSFSIGAIAAELKPGDESIALDGLVEQSNSLIASASALK